MVHLITGNKGKGKTKWMLNKANEAVKEILGSICYLDKSSQHMYDLNNRIRLINVNDYMVENDDQFLGFVSGIISQDHDLEQMYFDSFLNISNLENADFAPAISRLQKLSEKFNVDFFISISVDDHEIPEEMQELVMVSL
ncbi:MAG: twitching motility protein PilT [Lachnospiraceae bacterium]|nr:twitching motility protein PilT [Lachnospiraceae bacterium]